MRDQKERVFSGKTASRELLHSITSGRSQEPFILRRSCSTLRRLSLPHPIRVLSESVPHLPQERRPDGWTLHEPAGIATSSSMTKAITAYATRETRGKLPDPVW